MKFSVISSCPIIFKIEKIIFLDSHKIGIPPYVNAKSPTKERSSVFKALSRFEKFNLPAGQVIIP